MAKSSLAGKSLCSWVCAMDQYAEISKSIMGESNAEAKEVKLNNQLPPLKKLTDELNQFENCIKLSLSTNAIECMIALPGLKKL
jgi:hypothetical protein